MINLQVRKAAVAEKAAPEEDGGESSSESEDEDKWVFIENFIIF